MNRVEEKLEKLNKVEDESSSNEDENKYKKRNCWRKREVND